MKPWAFFLAVGALLPLLAGCNAPPSETPGEPLTTDVAADRLENATFYAFQHLGGDLAVSVAGNGSADLVLFGGDDERLGHIGVGAERARGRFVLEGVEAGELVLQVISLNGTLDLRSDGSAVHSFRALPVHLERHVLVQLGSSSPIIGLPGTGGSVDETVEVELLRAPVEIIAIGDATFDSLDIVVRGDAGIVYQASLGANPLGAVIGPYAGRMPGEDVPENMHGRSLSARVQSNSFEGVVVLEARSFSRAALAEGDALLTDDVPRFTYGVLPDQPVGFEVRAGTTVLYLWQEDPEGRSDCEQEATDADGTACGAGEAHVALFGPQDERIATVAVPANRTLAIPVREPGAWVAVLLDGEATLGADRVPSDFELHPLAATETTLPAAAAGGDDEYGQDRRDLDAPGVPFRIVPTVIAATAAGVLPTSPGFGLIWACTYSAVSVLLDDETIAAWGYEIGRSPAMETTPIDPALLLGDGELDIAYSDFGPSCDRNGIVVHSYER